MGGTSYRGRLLNQVQCPAAQMHARASSTIFIQERQVSCIYLEMLQLPQDVMYTGLHCLVINPMLAQEPVQRASQVACFSVNLLTCFQNITARRQADDMVK